MSERRHIHTTLTEEEFRAAKITAVLLGKEMQEFIREAVLEKINKEKKGERDCTNSRQGSTS